MTHIPTRKSNGTAGGTSDKAEVADEVAFGESTEATSKLPDKKEGAQALSRTAEVLAADVKARAQHTAESAREKFSEAATESAQVARRMGKPAAWVAAGAIALAGLGLLLKRRRTVTTERRQWWRLDRYLRR
jgi:hypothetical protein